MGYFFLIFVYKCGYSGERVIKDVKFEVDDYMELDSIMCGFVLCVFVFGEDDIVIRSEKMRGLKEFFLYDYDLFKEWIYCFYINKFLFIFILVEFSVVKFIRIFIFFGFLFLFKGFFFFEELIMFGRYDINLNIFLDF